MMPPSNINPFLLARTAGSTLFTSSRCLAPCIRRHQSSSTPSTSTGSSTSTSCAPSYIYGRPSAKALKAAIPPIRAHILSEPLPYPVGLKLQGDIIDARLRRREKGEGGRQDVLLLLGTSDYCVGRLMSLRAPCQCQLLRRCQTAMQEEWVRWLGRIG